ncbi:MAG TPA: hypothetical protein VGM16_03540 [Gammaproteobacteria bacterium]|jgi:hypothetical protein
MNRKTFALVSLTVLLALTLVGRAATAEARVLKSFKADCVPVQTGMAIPDNVLTGHGAMAAGDGRLYR